MDPDDLTVELQVEICVLLAKELFKPLRDIDYERYLSTLSLSDAVVMVHEDSPAEAENTFKLMEPQMKHTKGGAQMASTRAAEQRVLMSGHILSMVRRVLDDASRSEAANCVTAFAGAPALALDERVRMEAEGVDVLFKKDHTAPGYRKYDNLHVRNASNPIAVACANNQIISGEMTQFIQVRQDAANMATRTNMLNVAAEGIRGEGPWLLYLPQIEKAGTDLYVVMNRPNAEACDSAKELAQLLGNRIREIHVWSQRDLVQDQVTKSQLDSAMRVSKGIYQALQKADEDLVADLNAQGITTVAINGCCNAIKIDIDYMGTVTLWNTTKQDLKSFDNDDYTMVTDQVLLKAFYRDAQHTVVQKMPPARQDYRKTKANHMFKNVNKLFAIIIIIVLLKLHKFM